MPLLERAMSDRPHPPDDPPRTATPRPGSEGGGEPPGSEETTDPEAIAASVDERRSGVRTRISERSSYVARVGEAEIVFRGVVTNWSGGGVFIRTDEPLLELGAELRLALIEDGRRVYRRGVVRWVHQPQSIEEPAAGMGVALLEEIPRDAPWGGEKATGNGGAQYHTPRFRPLADSTHFEMEIEDEEDSLRRKGRERKLRRKFRWLTSKPQLSDEGLAVDAPRPHKLGLPSVAELPAARVPAGPGLDSFTEAFLRKSLGDHLEWISAALHSGLVAAVDRELECYLAEPALTERGLGLPAELGALKVALDHLQQWYQPRLEKWDEVRWRKLMSSGENESFDRMAGIIREALWELSRLRLADLVERSERAHQQAMKDKPALRAEISKTRDELEGLRRAYRREPYGNPQDVSFACRVEETNTAPVDPQLRRVSRFVGGEMNELSDVLEFVAEPVGSLVRPVQKALLDRIAEQAHDAEALLPAQLLRLAQTHGVYQQRSTELEQLEKALRDGHRAMLSQLVQLRNSLETLEITVERLERFAERFEVGDRAREAAAELAETYHGLVRRMDELIPEVGLEEVAPAPEADNAPAPPQGTKEVARGPHGLLQNVVRKSYRFESTGEPIA